MEYTHCPVLLPECLAILAPGPGKTIVDGTVGLGGHSQAILEAGAKVICLDKDGEALQASRECLARFGRQAVFVRSDFRDLAHVLDDQGIQSVDGILLDLGVSSLQLDKPGRGFSFHNDAPADMRMDGRSALTAKDILNHWPSGRLRDILYQYGEERYAPRIAAAIEKNRPIETTLDLREIIIGALPARARREDQHPARRTFQALRIAVNDELEALREGLAAGLERLAPEGRMAVISFHSLEDRIVKQMFQKQARGCICPPSFPACVCENRPKIKLLGRFVPDSRETATNPRAASARLRGAEKLKDAIGREEQE